MWSTEKPEQVTFQWDTHPDYFHSLIRRVGESYEEAAQLQILNSSAYLVKVFSCGFYFFFSENCRLLNNCDHKHMYRLYATRNFQRHETKRHLGR